MLMKPAGPEKIRKMCEQGFDRAASRANSRLRQSPFCLLSDPETQNLYE